MLRVLFKLVVMQPELLLTHAKNYADLASDGLHQTVMAWKLRLMLYAISTACLVLGLTSGAVGLLLWAGLPELNPEYSWLLVAQPIFLFALSACFYWGAQRSTLNPLFDDLQEQLKLDMLTICQKRTP